MPAESAAIEQHQELCEQMPEPYLFIEHRNHIRGSLCACTPDTAWTPRLYF